MRLPVPGPRDVLSALERGGDQVEAMIGAVPRALALLDRAEALLDGATVAVDRVREVDRGRQRRRRTRRRRRRRRGDRGRAGQRAHRLPRAVADQAAATLETLADTTQPRGGGLARPPRRHAARADRAVETDVLPVLATLGSVAPDVHDLLTVARELNDMLAKIPGMGRLKRRIDEEEGEDETDATVR